MTTTLLDVCHHVRHHLLSFFGLQERRRFKAINTTCRGVYLDTEDQCCVSLHHGHQWATIARQLSRIHTLHVFPNALPYLQTAVQSQHLLTLKLSSCGLTAENVRSLGVTPALRVACRLRHLSVSHNPYLKTKGLSLILRALTKAGTTLHCLAAAETGINRVPYYETLSQLRSLDVINNQIGKTATMEILRLTPKLDKLFMGVRAGDEAVDLLSAGSIATLSWCRPGTSEGVKVLLACDTMQSLSISWGGAALQWDHIGTSLTRLSLSTIDIPAAQWDLFLKTLAQQASLTELLFSRVKNLTAQAIVAFVEQHRDPSVFGALGLLDVPEFTYTDLTLVCQMLTKKQCKMRKWILNNCRALRFPASAQVFVDTFSDKMYLDLNTRTPLLFRRQDEAAWISAVLTSKTDFQFLGLGGRYVVMDVDATPDMFGQVEQMCLENSEINWGFSQNMTRLRALSMYNIESRCFSPTQLLTQALRLPRVSHLRLDYCHFEDALDDFPVTKYINTLSLNWCKLSPEFQNSLLHALVLGKFPALSSLGILQGASQLLPSFICLLVLALKKGQRNTSVDARGHPWKVCELQHLCISLRQLGPGDLSCLRLTVPLDAVAEMNRIRKLFPTILFP